MNLCFKSYHFREVYLLFIPLLLSQSHVWGRNITEELLTYNEANTDLKGDDVCLHSILNNGESDYIIENIPDWAKDVVWYQIFPERFRNGDPTNDPRIDDIGEDHIEGWKIKEWGSDWYFMDEWEEQNFDNVFQSIFRRRYGGDLQGVIDKLDYLQELGVTAIYLNPIFRSPSLHKYDASCFHHIDETFGPDPEGDRKLIVQAQETEDPETWVWTKADKLFLEIVREVHRRDMRIIIDGVFNHSGRTFFAFKDILEKGKDSRYIEWYEITNWDKRLPDGFEYEGWFGIKSLPEFKKDQNGLNEPVKRYIFDIIKRWMTPDGKVGNGVDGWRLDVAFCIPHPFWKEFRKFVKEINPQAYITAEIIEIEPEYLKGDEFDGLMNYPFAFAVTEFFIDRKNKISVSEFDHRLRELRGSYPYEINFIIQNLISSHDTPRLRTLVVNPDMHYRKWSEHFQNSKVEFNPNYRIDRGALEELNVHKLIAIFQMTYIGAPMIYYGDEVGMTGANDPDCRKPMLWSDIEYEGEITHPHPNRKRPREKNKVDMELYEHYKTLINIRNGSIALRQGTFKTVLVDDEKDVYGYSREFEDEKIVVVINNSNSQQDISLKIQEDDWTEFGDLLNPGTILKTQGSQLKIKVKPKWAVILKRIPWEAN